MSPFTVILLVQAICFAVLGWELASMLSLALSIVNQGVFTWATRS